MALRGIFRLTAVSALAVLWACSPAEEAPRVQLTRTNHQVEVSIDSKPFTTYYFGSESPKPYLHPLRTPRGVVVTRGYPMRDDIPGESKDHPHHRAMYFTHGDVNGVDFWSEGRPRGAREVETVEGRRFVSEGMPRGRTVFKEMLTLSSGEETGELSALFELLGPDNKVIAEEVQKYRFLAESALRTIDCEFTIRATTDLVKLGDTKEGTFAIRVAQELKKSNGATMFSSQGAIGEDQIWGKPAHWVDYTGTFGDERIGIAIFDHPSNFRHPTYWHARGYGLFAANPFGEHDFFRDPERDGSVTIAPGESLTLRYRVIIHPGDPEDARLSERYQIYQALNRAPSEALQN